MSSPSDEGMTMGCQRLPIRPRRRERLQLPPQPRYDDSDKPATTAAKKLGLGTLSKLPRQIRDMIWKESLRSPTASELRHILFGNDLSEEPGDNMPKGRLGSDGRPVRPLRPQTPKIYSPDESEKRFAITVWGAGPDNRLLAVSKAVYGEVFKILVHIRVDRKRAEMASNHHYYDFQIQSLHDGVQLIFASLTFQMLRPYVEFIRHIIVEVPNLGFFTCDTDCTSMYRGELGTRQRWPVPPENDICHIAPPIPPSMKETSWMRLWKQMYDMLQPARAEVITRPAFTLMVADETWPPTRWYLASETESSAKWRFAYLQDVMKFHDWYHGEYTSMVGKVPERFQAGNLHLGPILAYQIREEIGLMAHFCSRFLDPERIFINLGNSANISTTSCGGDEFRLLNFYIQELMGRSGFQHPSCGIKITKRFSENGKDWIPSVTYRQLWRQNEAWYRICIGKSERSLSEKKLSNDGLSEGERDQLVTALRQGSIQFTDVWERDDEAMMT